MKSVHELPDLLLCDVGDTLVRWEHYDRSAGMRAMAPLVDRPDQYTEEVIAQMIPGAEALDAHLEERAGASGIEFRQADFLRSLFGQHGFQLLCDDDHLEWLYWRSALTFALEPDVEESLERISGMGVRLGIISNTVFGPVTIMNELARLGIDDFFLLPAVTSARFAVRKPHPSIFHAAIGLLGGTVERTWYVGNSVPFDVGGANAAGIVAVWYNEDGETLADHAAHGERADLIVDGWAVLADHIESLAVDHTHHDHAHQDHVH